MPLKVEQLSSHLKKNGLAPVWLISGDEPMQKLEAADTLRKHALEQGVAERLVINADSPGFSWQEFRTHISSLSLFAEQRLLELRLGDRKPKKDAGDQITEALEKLGSQDILLITSARLDKSTRGTKWFKQLDMALRKCKGVRMDIWPVPVAQLPGWIQQRVQNAGKQISQEDAVLIAQRVEGNLLAAKQEIEKLCALVEEKEIHSEQVLRSVVDSSHFDVFALFESAFMGKRSLSRTLHILRSLQEEGVEPMALYGALMWEMRRLCRMAHLYDEGQRGESLMRKFAIWDRSRQVAVQRVLAEYDLQELHALLRVAIQIEEKIKIAASRSVSVWDEFRFFLLRMAGVGAWFAAQ